MHREIDDVLEITGWEGTEITASQLDEADGATCSTPCRLASHTQSSRGLADDSVHEECGPQPQPPRSVVDPRTVPHLMRCVPAVWSQTVCADFSTTHYMPV